MASGECCQVKASLLSELSSVSNEHARQAAILTAIAPASAHDGFTEMMDAAQKPRTAMKSQGMLSKRISSNTVVESTHF